MGLAAGQRMITNSEKAKSKFVMIGYLSLHQYSLADIRAFVD
jgi:hypothetical protein